MKKMKLFNLILVSLALIFSLTTMTLAWQTTRKNNDLENILVGIGEEGELGFNITVYQYDLEKKNNDSNKVNIVSANDEGVINVKMNNYDAIFTSDNEYSPIIVRVAVSTGSLSVGDDVRLTITRNPALDTGTAERLGDVLSSVIRIRGAAISTAIISEEASPDDVYSTVQNYFTSSSNYGQTFVSVDLISEATSGVRDVEMTGTRDVVSFSSTTTSLSAGQVVKIGYNGTYLKINGTSLTTSTLDDATEWTVSGSSNNWKFQTSDGQYLAHGSSTTGSISVSATDSNNTWKYDSAKGLYYTYQSTRSTYYFYLNYASSWTVTRSTNSNTTTYKNVSFNLKKTTTEEYTYTIQEEYDIPAVYGYVKKDALNFDFQVPDSSSTFYVYFYFEYDTTLEGHTNLMNKFVHGNTSFSELFSDYYLKPDLGYITISDPNASN